MAEEDDQITPMPGEGGGPIITRRKYAGLSGLTGDTFNGGMKRLLESNSQRLERIGIKTEKDQEQRLAKIATAMTVQSIASQQQTTRSDSPTRRGDDEEKEEEGSSPSSPAYSRPSTATASSMPSLSEFTESTDTFPNPVDNTTTKAGLLGDMKEPSSEFEAPFDYDPRSSTASNRSTVEEREQASMEILQDNARIHRDSQEAMNIKNTTTTTGGDGFMYDMCTFETWDGSSAQGPTSSEEPRESFHTTGTEKEEGSRRSQSESKKMLEEPTKTAAVLSTSAHQTNNNSQQSENNLEEIRPPSPLKIRTRSIEIDFFEDTSSDFFATGSSSELGKKPSSQQRNSTTPPSSTSVYPIPALDDEEEEKKKAEEKKKKDINRRKGRVSSSSRSPPRKTSSGPKGSSRSPSASWSRDKSPLSRPKVVDRTSSTGGRGRSTSTKRTDSNGGGAGRSKSSNPSSLGNGRKDRMAKRASSQGLDSSCSSNEGGGMGESRRGRRKSSSLSPDGAGGKADRKASMCMSERVCTGTTRSSTRRGTNNKEKGSFNHDEFQNYVNSYFENTNMGESVARLMLEDFVIKKKLEKATGGGSGGGDDDKKGGRGRGRGRGSSSTRSSSLAARGRARSSSKSPLNGGGGGDRPGRSPGPALQRTKSRSLSPDKTRQRNTDHSPTSTRESRRGGGGGGGGGGIAHSSSGVGLRRQQASEGDLLTRRRADRSTERPGKNFSYDRKSKDSMSNARKEGYARRRTRHEQRRQNDRAALESYMTTKAEEDAKEALEEAIEELEEEDSSELKADGKREGKFRNSGVVKMGKLGVQVIKKTNKVTHVGKGVKALGKVTHKTAKVVGKNTVGRTTQFLTNRLVKDGEEEEGKDAMRKSNAEPKPAGKYNTLPDLEPLDLEAQCDEAFKMVAT